MTQRSSVPRLGPASTLALGALLALLATYAAFTVHGFWLAIHYPHEMDYGEGIVWYQATLMPGPRMYSTSRSLPFIVFHYPPVFHLLSRAALAINPDFLAAGRWVSTLATLLTAPAVSALVLVASRRPGRRPGLLEGTVAVAAGLLMLAVHAFRDWGPLMRVDMVSILLTMLGVLAGAVAAGRFWGTTLALLLCTAAVFTKQTQLPAGVAVFLVALLRNPRGALGAAAVAGCAGLAALGALQLATDGGFLQNIIGNNINRMGLRHAYWVFWPERTGIPLMLLMGLGTLHLAATLVPSLLRLRLGAIVREVAALRVADRPTAARALLLLHITLATLMLPTSFKSGGSFNYTLEWFAAGCAVTGMLLIDLVRSGLWRGWGFRGAVAALALVPLLQPLRMNEYTTDATLLRRREALVERIRAAEQPVLSDDMVLLMRAGKPVIVEPSIVTELAIVGRWDERPLVDMIRSGGFAFIITNDNAPGVGPHRTLAVDAAMREAYPRVERIESRLWLNLPR